MPRTSPTKLATPPIPVLPRVSASSSAPMSKSSRCTRIIASASGDRREERHFVAGTDGMIPGDIFLVDRDADDRAVAERLGEAGPARLQPVEQSGHGGDTRRRLERLLGLADLLAQPREIKDLHASDLGGRSQ